MDFIQLTILLRQFLKDNHGYDFTTYYYENKPNQFWFAVDNAEVLTDLMLSESCQNIRSNFEDYKFTVCFLGSTGIENIKNKKLSHNTPVVHLA